jgi:hypothetical protein
VSAQAPQTYQGLPIHLPNLRHLPSAVSHPLWHSLPSAVSHPLWYSPPHPLWYSPPHPLWYSPSLLVSNRHMCYNRPRV